MLYFVVGLPGRFSLWCDAIVAHLVQRAHGTGTTLAADTLADLAASAIATGTSHGVIACRRPGGHLRTVLADNGRRFVVALDDPRRALVDLVRSDNLDIAAATPIIATSCAAIAGYDRTAGGCVIRADAAAADPMAAATAIARHLDLALDAADIAAIVEQVAGDGMAADCDEAAAGWHALDADPRAWAEGALSGYVSYFDTGVLSPLSWARELFFLGDRPDDRASWIVDITGRARCLLQGPGIMVAPGSWLINVKLLFSKEATEREFLVELLADRQLAAIIIRPEREGGFEVNFPLTLDEAVNHPLTIRLCTQRAAFDGACAMDAVILTPQE